MIAGYLATKSSGFKWSRIVKLILQVTFYSVILYVVTVFVGSVDFSIKHFVQSCVPFISGGGYWFIVMYIILMFFSPLLIAGAKAINKRQLRTLLVILFAIYCPLNLIAGKIITINDFGYNRFTWMLFVYLLGIYIGLYGLTIEDNKRLLISVFVSSTIILCGAILASEFNLCDVLKGFPLRISKIVVTILSKDGINSLCGFLMGLSLFLIVKNSPVKQSRILQIIGPATFGVYLIHDNHWFRSFMWTEIFMTISMQDSKIFLLYSVAVVAVIFVVCTGIELLRIRFIEKPFFEYKPVKELLTGLDAYNRK